jgi:hypothetical protein
VIERILWSEGYLRTWYVDFESTHEDEHRCVENRDMVEGCSGSTALDQGPICRPSLPSAASWHELKQVLRRWSVESGTSVKGFDFLRAGPTCLREQFGIQG